MQAASSGGAMREAMLRWKEQDLLDAMHAARRVAEACEEMLREQQRMQIDSIMTQWGTAEASRINLQVWLCSL